MKKELVLFIASGANAFDQQLATALFLQSKGGIQAHFLLITKSDHQSIALLNDAGMSFSTLDAFRDDGNESTNRVEDTSPWGAKSKGLGPFKVFYWWNYFAHRKRLTKKLIQPLSPRCALVSQERPRFFLPVLKALRELQIPIILIPTGFDSFPDSNAWARRGSSHLTAGLKNHIRPSKTPKRLLGTAVLNKLVRFWLPAQVYSSRWGMMLFYPAVQTLLLKIMGMLPQNPWYQGTTFPDYIMISGADEANLYAEARVSPAKILLYGSHEFDNLYEKWTRRKSLLRELTETYQLDNGKPILIVTPPRLWEQNLASAEVHWQSIKDIFGVLSKMRCNVLVSLHPHSDQQLYRWIQEEYTVKICNERLTEILVVADIFVASYSSTLRLAVGLGIPSVNVDLWGLNFEMYESLPDIDEANTIAELEASIKALAKTFRTAQDNNDCTLSDRTNPIVVDGKAKERLFSFIQSTAIGSGDTGIDRKLPSTSLKE